MFTFNEKTSGKSWYYEGPEEIVKISNATNTGSIDTTSIDAFRQGVEITQQKYWTNGIGKIHAGENDHVMRQNVFGQDTKQINDEPDLGTSWYKDIDYFDPVKYIEAQELGQYDYIRNLTFPIVTSDIDQIENYVFNGIIEPMAIRSVASFFSVHLSGYEATGIKGMVMEGNSDIRYASEPIVHVHKYETSFDTTPFLDMIDMIGITPTATHFDITVSPITPYDDAGGTREQTMSSILNKNISDMCNAINGLEFDTENYVPTKSVSSTSGFVFDNTPAGTDSLAFGGMTY